MPSSSIDSHASSHRVAHSLSDKRTNGNEQRRLSTQSSTGNKTPGKLFERLKFGSSSKRKTRSTSTVAISPVNDNNAITSNSPSTLPQRLQALLDAHPVNSPSPSFQPLPTPSFTPPNQAANGSAFPVPSHDAFPASPVPGHATLAGPSNQLYGAAPSPVPFSPQFASPADPEIIAFLSSPALMNGSLQPELAPIPEQPHTPTTSSAGGTNSNQPRSPRMFGRRQSIWSMLDNIGSPKARARRLSRVDEGLNVRERKDSVMQGGRNEYVPSPRMQNMSPAVSSVVSPLPMTPSPLSASYGSDGHRALDEEFTDDDDDTSIMLYSPLMPTPSSLVSIAESEIVSFMNVPEEAEEEGERQGEAEATTDAASPVQDTQQPTETRSAWSLSSVWPFSSWFSSPSAQPATTPASNPNQNLAQPASRPTSSSPPGLLSTMSTRVTTVVTSVTNATVASPSRYQPQRLARRRTRRVWVPSRTQLSLETMWWGYRIYVPPLVLENLNSTQLETSRRAALLTAALTWFFTHFPVHVLPPPVRPVIIILQGLVPYLGYVGGILSWSWGTIRGYDEGYGIILTATWLLPIALIPSSWVPPPSEWPGSPLASTTIPTSPPMSSPRPPLQQQENLYQMLDRGEEQGQEPSYLPHSPYSPVRTLSPPPPIPGSYSTAASNESPYMYPYTLTPVMTMTPLGTSATGTTMYSPLLTPVPMVPIAFTPVPGSPTPAERVERRNGEGAIGTSLYAPRMATVPLPEDDQ
ncbi:hypothetical protein AX17_004218 [Amanita inopinata Kibby_2008]|nr:hypothetical protein AX17_004218 [Amanita inopinata Kibby_2008]